MDSRARSCHLIGHGTAKERSHLNKGRGPVADARTVRPPMGQKGGRAVPGRIGAPLKEEKGESTKGSVCPFSTPSIAEFSPVCNRIMVLCAVVIGCALCQYPSETRIRIGNRDGREGLT